MPNETYIFKQTLYDNFTVISVAMQALNSNGRYFHYHILSKMRLDLFVNNPHKSTVSKLLKSYVNASPLT